MRFSSGSIIRTMSMIAGLAAFTGAAPPQGPTVAGLFGRKAGAHEEFKYTDALKSADWVWDEAHLDKWIENAQAMRPGVVMPYHQADPAKRAKVIEFLKTLKAPS